MRDYLLGITILSFCFVNSSFGEPVINELNKELVKYFTIKPGEQSNDMEIVASKSKEDAYLKSESIQISYIITNKSTETKYYWTGDMSADLMLWYWNGINVNFLYTTVDRTRISQATGTVHAWKPGESIQGEVILDSKNYPQIYEDLNDIEYSKIYICIVGNTALFKQHPWGYGGTRAPRGTRVYVKSKLILIEIANN